MISTLNEALSQVYPRHTVAHALFSKTTLNEPSFRFEAYELGWEFSDGGHIGPGPSGIFFYKDGFFHGKNARLPKDQPTKADYYVDQRKEEDAIYVHVKFYVPGSSDELLGEFVASDQLDSANSSGILGSRREAVWNLERYTTAPAIAFKEKNSTRITLEFASKVAEMHCNENDDIYGEAIDDVHGKLAFKSFDLLEGDSKSVKWSGDHVVFNKDVDSGDFTAFFLPHERLVQKPINAKHATNLSWKDMAS